MKEYIATRYTIRFERRLVQFWLYALQTTKGPLTISTTQNKGQTRNRPNDTHNGNLLIYFH